MTGVKINSNVFALQAVRRLEESSNSFSAILEHLSSGQRINKASDDAAGLAVSEALKSDARVFGQAIRNVNDGVSALTIAQGALEQLSAICLRQKELAEQAANGPYTITQRRAMNSEANALVDEFNRITQTTEFNGIRLLDKSLSTFSIQAGHGDSGNISFGIGDSLARTVGDGTFGARVSYGVGYIPKAITVGDVNNDGVSDVLTADDNGGTVSVLLSMGDGTFGASKSFAVGTGPGAYGVQLADLNKDGALDVIALDPTGYAASILIGNGNGTFQARATYGSANVVSVADMNRDGILDLVTVRSNESRILLGNGNGTFALGATTAVSGVQDLKLGDFNGDDIPDMVVVDWSGDKLSVYLGRGDGTFGTSFTCPAGDQPWFAAIADVNGDGSLDIVSAARQDGKANVHLGNGDGTFKARMSFRTGTSPISVALTDINGDGILDMATGDNGAQRVASIFIGNGDGTFNACATYASNMPYGVALADMNRDGVPDLLTADRGGDSVSLFLANTRKATVEAKLNLCTRAGALDALGTIASTLDRVTSELGAIGSQQSRLSFALNTLAVARENYSAAAARIVDADIAQEAAELLRTKILQQAGAAVLAQANQLPALALRLIGIE